MDKDPGPSDQNRPKRYNSYLKYSGLAFQLVITIGVAGWLGYLLDNYLNLKFPLFLITFILVAFVGIMYRLYNATNNPD